MDEKKTCKTCGRTLPLDDFPITDKKHGYRRASCRDCERERKRKWKEDHKERSEKNYQAWKKKNKCHLQKYMKEYNKRRSEAQKEYKREHWLKNRERYIQKKREDYYEHREEILAQKRKVYHYNRRYKKLTREQQLEIFDNNRGLVSHIAKRYKCHEYLYDDMIQAGFVGLWRGIKELDKYNPNKSSLSTWLGWYIMTELGNFSYKAANNSGLSGAMRYAMKRNGGYDDAESEEDRRLFSTAVSLDAPLDSHDNDEATIAETISCEDEYDDGLSEAVKKLLSALNDRDRDCVVRNFGIGCEPQTKKDIAKDYGVSGSTIGNWISAALEQLRDQPGTSSLLVYLP